MTDRPVFTVVKDAHSIRGVERAHPHGRELRVLHAGELLWWRVFRPGDPQTLEAEAEEQVATLTARGWTVAT